MTSLGVAPTGEPQSQFRVLHVSRRFRPLVGGTEKSVMYVSAISPMVERPEILRVRLFSS